MAWTTTRDEQDTLAAGAYQDAPFDLATTFRLAEGAALAAQGLLTAGDRDLYSLGTLYKGTYTFVGSVVSWYAGSGFGGTAAPLLRLYKDTGAAASSAFAPGPLTFEVASPGAYFLAVANASSTLGGQYELSYQRVAPANQPASATTAITGVPVPGNSLFLTGSLSDANGTTSSSLAFQWLSGTTAVGTGSSYTVRAEDVGRALDVVVTFVDDAGYTETFSPEAVTGRARNAGAPTVAITADDLSLKAGEAARIEFRLSAPSVNFSAADVTVSGGVLSGFAGSGDFYTALFTPAQESTTAASLSVNGGVFSTASGLLNEDGGDADNRLSFAVDTVRPVAPKLVADPTSNLLARPQLRVETTIGSFEMSLRPDKAPASVANLLAYAEDGYYAGTLFHRVVQGFVVQGGGYSAGPLYKPPTYAPIVLESANGLSNTRGTVAMARTSEANSATSQFYVNLVDNSASLDWKSNASPGYAVFGEVVSGMAVIDAMAAVSVGSAGGLSNVPAVDITIQSATQTVAGLASGTSARLTLTDLEAGSSWEYSLDAGRTWRAGSGTSLSVPEGRYALGDILVRQTDVAGNPSPDANRFGMELQVDDPATGQVQVRAWGWRSHELMEGVRLSTPVEAQVLTGAQGAATLRGGLGPALTVQAAFQPAPALAAADSAAVTLRDAVAILKMIAGQPVNPAGAPISPFQSLAADADGDGHVGLADALAVLRHSVGHSAGTSAVPAPGWVFIDERDTTLAARPVLEPGAPPLLSVGVDPAAATPAHLGLVAVLRGDVDGSHVSAAGAATLDSAHPGYLEALIDELGVSPSRFGVYPS